VGLSQVFRFLARAVLALLALFALLAVVLWLDHRRETLLPALSGPNAVSRTMQVWTAADQVDEFSPDRSGRILVAWIWYPSVITPARQPYFPADWRAAVERQRGTLISTFLTRDLSRVRTNSQVEGELAAKPGRFPLVIFRPGLAAPTLSYSALAEELASHGYVVVGFDAPYRTSVVVLPDARIVERTKQNDVERQPAEQQEAAALRLQLGWSSNISFVIDQLAALDRDATSPFHERLDLQRIGVFGHSLGGATAAQFCHDDARCKAGIDIDGALRGAVIRRGLSQPFLLLTADHRGEAPRDTARIEADLRAVYAANPADKSSLVINGASHFAFSDDGALLKSPLLRAAFHGLGITGLEGSRQLDLTRQIVRAFFDVHLKGASPSVLDAARAQPEVSAPDWLH
jgi:predicted dienelactone hydrolase